MTKWEIVTIGYRPGFTERNNARYHVQSVKPECKVGDKWKSGDYLVEVIMIREKLEDKQI